MTVVFLANNGDIQFVTPKVKAMAGVTRFQAVSGDGLSVAVGERQFPPFVRTEDDKQRFLATLAEMPSDEELELFATKPSKEWLAQRAQK